MINVKFKNNEKLLKILKTAENILNINQTGNIIKFVKLENLNNQLQITAINPVMKLEYLMNVDEILGDSVLYDYKKFNALLNVINGNIEIKDGVVRGSNCEYKISWESAEDYPKDIIPEITNYSILKTDEFKKALENTFIVSDKILTGVLSGVNINDNKLIGCDSKRISIENIETDDNIKNITLQKEFIKEILRLPFEYSLFIAKFGERIIIKDEFITISSSIFTEKYPLVEKILPKEIKNTITLKNKDLYNALIMITPVMDEFSKECSLEINKDSMKVFINKGNESAETEIKIQSNIDEKITVKFNMQYLLDMLKTLDDEIKITTFNDQVGYKFESTEKSYQYIMPMIN